MQRTLKPSQLENFYHDQFVSQQVEHFRSIALSEIDITKFVVDVGGGCGYFSIALQKQLGLKLRLIDMDPISVESARQHGVEASVCDALTPLKKGDEGIVCFNLILHHLVANSDSETLAMQEAALLAWHDNRVPIFVNEYIYESWLGNFSGRLIFQITNKKLFSLIAKYISKIVPSLRANTFFTGVRFRSSSEWKDIFEKIGYEVVHEQRGDKEQVSLARRFLLIKEIRRDSFFLRPF